MTRYMVAEGNKCLCCGAVTFCIMPDYWVVWRGNKEKKNRRSKHLDVYCSAA